MGVQGVIGQVGPGIYVAAAVVGHGVGLAPGNALDLLHQGDVLVLEELVLHQD